MSNFLPGRLFAVLLAALFGTCGSASAGGPGTGAGVVSGLMDEFVGDVTLRGLFVTSPDSAAVGLLMIGDLLIEDLTVEGAGGDGLFAQVDGDYAIARVLTRLNGSTGWVVTASGNGSISAATALRNQGAGLIATAEQMLTLDDVEAGLNTGAGLQAAACVEFDARDIVVDTNTEDGGLLVAGTEECASDSPTSGGVAGATAGFDWTGPELPGSAETIDGSPDAVLALNNVTATDNSNLGFLARSSGSATLGDVFAYDNQSIGIFAESVTLLLDNAEAIGNLTGIFAAAESVDAVRVVANASLPMPSNPPFEGSGWSSAAPTFGSMTSRPTTIRPSVS